MYKHHFNWGRMQRIQEKVEEGTSYRQRVILDHLNVLPAAEVFNLSVQHDPGNPVGDLGYLSLGLCRRIQVSRIYR